MKESDARHYAEEELLLFLLKEDSEETRREVASHVAECRECNGVLQEYEQVVRGISEWLVPELSEASWEASKLSLIRRFRQDQAWLQKRSFFRSLQQGIQALWNYALENPLPTMGYIAVAIAFASERTITVFRLDRILPASSELLQILRQVL